MKTYCDNCGRNQKVYTVILAYASGTAKYCEDCIINNPHVTPMCFECGKNPAKEIGEICSKCSDICINS